MHKWQVQEQNLLLVLRCSVLPAPGTKALGYSEMKMGIPGVFSGISFSFLHFRFPPPKLLSPSPQTHTPAGPAKQNLAMTDFFFHKFLFLSPPDTHEGIKNHVSVSFLALCTDHHQLSQAALKKKKINSQLSSSILFDIHYSSHYFLNQLSFLPFFFLMQLSLFSIH